MHVNVVVYDCIPERYHKPDPINAQGSWQELAGLLIRDDRRAFIRSIVRPKLHLWSY